MLQQANYVPPDFKNNFALQSEYVLPQHLAQRIQLAYNTDTMPLCSK